MIFAVATATGVQGMSVVKHALHDEELMHKVTKIRCLVRNPESEKAKELAAVDPRIELFKTDLSVKADVAKAFEGVWAVFYNLNSFDPSIASRETEIGNWAVDLAIEKGIQVFVFSSLTNAHTRSNGELIVPHFVSKARTEEYLISKRDQILGIAVDLAFYNTNMATYFLPRKFTPEDEQFTVSTVLSPDGKFPIVDPADVGPVVALILRNPEQYKGRMIPVVAEVVTMTELVQKMQQHTGQPIRYFQMDIETSIKLMGPDLTNMFVFFDKYGFFPADVDLSQCSKIVGDHPFRTFDQWLKATNFTL